MSRLCDCPVELGLGRKCACLATPLIIKRVNEHLGDRTLDQLCDWVIKCARWRDKQAGEFQKGVKPENVELFIERVNEKRKQTKAALCDLLEYTAAAYHRKIRENQELQLQQDIDRLDDYPEYAELYDYPDFE